jgi:hypothetical protein
MTKSTKKTLPISSDSYDIIKKYCNENNLKISGWAEVILIKEIENEKSKKCNKVV